LRNAILFHLGSWISSRRRAEPTRIPEAPNEESQYLLANWIISTEWIYRTQFHSIQTDGVSPW
jgi:hypothetical protein